ncbi:hypothetical protein ACJX0J_030839 [Zea mays]
MYGAIKLHVLMSYKNFGWVRKDFDLHAAVICTTELMQQLLRHNLDYLLGTFLALPGKLDFEDMGIRKDLHLKGPVQYGWMYPVERRWFGMCLAISIQKGKNNFLPGLKIILEQFGMSEEKISFMQVMQLKILFMHFLVFTDFFSTAYSLQEFDSLQCFHSVVTILSEMETESKQFSENRLFSFSDQKQVGKLVGTDCFRESVFSEQKTAGFSRICFLKWTAIFCFLA